jgi:hypothetical protein
MRKFSAARIGTIIALGSGLLLTLCCGTAIALAGSRARSNAPQRANPVVPPGAHIDPSHVIYKWPLQINWRVRPGTPQISMLVGDPSKRGLHIQLIKWFPYLMSRPHFHNMDRFVTVLSKTWWVGTGTKLEPDTMVPMPAGSFVTDLADKVHYDGAKDGPVIIEIVGRGSPSPPLPPK